MAKVIGPWTPNYPVDFKSNGDTTRAAFGKHIQEIERIYGLLSGLGASKIEAEDLTAAMTANRNEWATAIAAEKSARESAIAAEKSARESAIAAEATVRSNGDIALGRRIDGLTFGDIGGTLGLDRTTGNLPADRVSGLVELIRANTVSEGNVNPNGYAKFGNGLIIQWGVTPTQTTFTEEVFVQSFPIVFPNNCFSVIMSMNIVANKSIDANYWPQLLGHSKNSFSYWYQAAERRDACDYRTEFVAFGN